MARSLSNAKLFSALIVDGISNAISRRGYATASQGVASSVARGATVSTVKKTEATEKVAWVPDPVTGYYRPENSAPEIDVAELRALLLKNKTKN